jgi:hypothetical protein
MIDEMVPVETIIFVLKISREAGIGNVYWHMHWPQ